jgi:hypothetical protein
MDYFLSVPDSPYYHWQLDLLIESFKNKDCEEKLSICIYRDQESAQVSYNENFLSNINSHGKKFYTNNVGEKRGCYELNKLYNILNFLSIEKISQPFMVIEPYSVIRREYELPKADDVTPSFTFAVDPFFTLEEVEKNVGPFYSWIGIERSVLESAWIPVGEFYIFNKVPINFFLDTVRLAEKLALQQMLATDKVWKRTADLALAINALINSSSILCRGDCNVISPINSEFESFFVSYKDGYLPNFHRAMFSYQPPFALSFGDPIEVLSEINYSPNSSYVSNIARRAFERRT